SRIFFFFFCSTRTTTPITYTLSLHDALPISVAPDRPAVPGADAADLAAQDAQVLGALGRLEPDQLLDAHDVAGVVEDGRDIVQRSEEHTSELQSLRHLVCRLLLEKKNETYKK